VVHPAPVTGVHQRRRHRDQQVHPRLRRASARTASSASSPSRASGSTHTRSTTST
jgi:hypothetical protein